MNTLNLVILFFAAMLGGALNSVAGGGSFISFPALIFTGVPPINANATSTVALWPGSVASTSAYRRELAVLDRVVLVVLSTISLIGGILGALLLLHTPQATFVRLIPYLMLVATLLFTFSNRITSTIRNLFVRKGQGQVKQEDEIENEPEPMPGLKETEETTGAKGEVEGEKFAVASRTSMNTRPGVGTLTGISILQLIISTYGGYFGGGMGILMLAGLAILGMENIHEMNALKTLLTSFVNGVAVLTFAIAGAVFWPEAILMVIGGIIGGYGGAYYARQLDPRLVRIFVIVVGFGMTIYFFIR
jgi:uncharacterized protein